ncbi:hypothetical protein B0G73_10113 [Paraburkholderia sp. BL25I1N1]|nr:hypothetical protein B0G73_10113 [Paraburkholderia sp. BL25I1N1]
MGRQPLHSQESIRAAALEMLAENSHGAPVSPALFRRVLSARRLRERMGGGGDSAAETIYVLSMSFHTNHTL